MVKKTRPLKIKSQKNRIKFFYVSFIVTICIFFLLWGLVRVDFQGRKMSIGDKTPPFSIIHQEENQVYFQVNSMGIERKWNISFAANSWKKIKDWTNPSEKNSGE